MPAVPKMYNNIITSSLLLLILYCCCYCCCFVIVATNRDDNIIDLKIDKYQYIIINYFTSSDAKSIPPRQ